MRAKSVLLLVIALGCGVVASVAVSQVVLDQKNRPEVQTVGILVVSKQLSAASRVNADAFRLEQWPVDRVPPGAVSDPKMIENKFTKQRLYPGEAIIEAKLSNKGKDFNVPAGFRIFDIPVKDDSGGGGYIGPGDHVDVFGYFDKSARVQVAKSVKVMENLEVVMIDGIAVVDLEATAQKKTGTIQLLVKEKQYAVLDTASNLAGGKLRLALRPREQASSDSVSDDGETFMAWLQQSDSPVVPDRKTVDSVTLPASQPRVTENFQMMVISPSKTLTYRWEHGQMVPQKPEESRESETSPLGGFQSQSYQPYPTKVQTPPKFQSQSQFQSPFQSPSSTQDQTSTAPVDPANSVQPNMTWDPDTGSWQTGGFKATYPEGK